MELIALFTHRPNQENETNKKKNREDFRATRSVPLQGRKFRWCLDLPDGASQGKLCAYIKFRYVDAVPPKHVQQNPDVLGEREQLLVPTVVVQPSPGRKDAGADVYGFHINAVHI